jgi:hypothetical protein
MLLLAPLFCWDGHRQRTRVTDQAPAPQHEHQRHYQRRVIQRHASAATRTPAPRHDAEPTKEVAARLIPVLATRG